MVAGDATNGGRLGTSREPSGASTAWSYSGCSPSSIVGAGFRECRVSETQDSRRHREEGPGVFTVMESQKKGAPVPRHLRTLHQKALRLQFYTFGIRGRRLSTGKADEIGR